MLDYYAVIEEEIWERTKSKKKGATGGKTGAELIQAEKSKQGKH